MAYHLLIAKSPSSIKFQFEHFLGSAVSVQHYWESVGQKLNLPIISSITEKADSEAGLVLAQEKLKDFRCETEVLYRYWLVQSADNELPDSFLEGIVSILDATIVAIENNMVVIIG